MPRIAAFEWPVRFESNDTIKGSKFHNDSLMGYGGDDTIDGEAGNDTLDGGADQDVLNGGAGTDLLYGRSGADSLAGGADSDNLIGWSGNDSLDGGTGADTMAGGLDDDWYYVDRVGDVVEERNNEGDADTVLSRISYTLGSNVERLWLLEASGAVNTAGNALDNVIIGNAQDNSLSGAAGDDTIEGGGGVDVLAGGSGDDLLLGNWTASPPVPDLSADTMIGGSGNDTYAVTNTADTVVESSNEGIDRVGAYMSYALGANVENLRLYGLAVDGTGNSLDNVIEGNGEDNWLHGAAGSDALHGAWGDDLLVGEAGSDTLTGGAGADTLRFEHLDEGADLIADFVSGTDRLALDNTGFGIAGTGTLAANGVSFVLGAAATGAGPAVIFNAVTHQVLWDADGTGAGGAQALATLVGVTTMSASDFRIV